LVRSAARAWQRPCIKSSGPQPTPTGAWAHAKRFGCSNARIRDRAMKPCALCTAAIPFPSLMVRESLQRIKTAWDKPCFSIDFKRLYDAVSFLTQYRAVSMVRAASRAGGPARYLQSSFAVVESMSDGGRERKNRQHRPTDEAALSARRQRLGEQLSRLRPSRPPETGPDGRPTSDMSGFARGFRLSTELVAGVLVGAGLGWLIDRWLGISPWGLIVFLLVGFAAGVLNLMRSAGVVPKSKFD